jgi:hypothetical protein
LGKRPQYYAPEAATTLMGPVCDQAELHGLLRKIRDLNLTLLAVINPLLTSDSQRRTTMEPERPGFAAEKRADNDNRKPRTSQPAARAEPAKPKQVSLGQRWSAIPVSKTLLFWACVAAIILTMIIGFTWGGWLRPGPAQKSADLMVREAVVNRLATICVAQFNLDPAKAQKLTELKETSSYQRAEYVTTQGWATMPGEEKPESRVADACAKQIMLLNP